MNKYFLIPVLFFVGSCNSNREEVIYQSDKFTLYADKVVQGSNVAEVLSPTNIKSNYKSPTSETFSRLITFKISINEKDNELPQGKNHLLIIGDEHESPIIAFGEVPTTLPESPGTYLPVNYEYTIWNNNMNVDLNRAMLDYVRVTGI